MSRVHYGGGGLECFCGKLYETLPKLKRHQVEIHFPRKCSCEVSFGTSNNFITFYTLFRYVDENLQVQVKNISTGKLNISKFMEVMVSGDFKTEISQVSTKL